MEAFSGSERERRLALVVFLTVMVLAGLAAVTAVLTGFAWV